MGITRTTGTLRTFPSGFLNHLAKTTSRRTSFHSEELDKICPDHANALRKAELVPPIFLTIGELWKNKYEKIDIENKQEPDFNKKKKKMSIFHFIFTPFFYLYIQGDLQAKYIF